MKASKVNSSSLFRLFLSLFCIFSLIPSSLFATHQRAGEITYRPLSSLTYEVTITTYTFAPSAADRCELTINWGDGQNTVLQRANGPSGITPAGIACDHVGEMVGPDIRLNIYVGVHTYPSPSTYLIWLEDPNRNMGIQNIPNSVDVPLYIETLLVINPFLGNNNSPKLLLPPVDNGCIGVPYLHNPGAYDPDGDSLSYRLVTPKGAGGLEVLGYQLPSAVDAQKPGTFTVNPFTGDVIWDNPTIQGEYNFALVIEEWRNGVRIGYVTRDMQVNIIACENEPPVLSIISDTCVIAGETINVRVSATDPDGDKLRLTASGGPLILPVTPATFVIPFDSAGSVSQTLVWRTSCANVRFQPYQIYFKVVDNGAPVNLFDLETMNIRVIAPPLSGGIAAPLGNNITLTWQQPPCPDAKGYKIYRRAGTSSFTPDPCDPGVPQETGYKLIATTDNVNQTNFVDNNNGLGLARGITYCYIVTYWFEDGSESMASEEFCSALKKDLPVITNVSIDSTSSLDGQITVIWSRPTELDLTQTPGPFMYRVLRAQGQETQGEIEVAQFEDLNDTTFVDRGMNTQDSAWTYRIEFINNTPGNIFPVGFSVPASSLFLETVSSDKMITLRINENVPWANEQYIIYRRQLGEATYDSLAISALRTYIDDSLVNGVQYCYYIRALGTYGTPGYVEPLVNFSQITCSVPVDNVPPCIPLLRAEVNCEALEILFSWDNIQETCAPDIKNYLLYRQSTPLQLIATIEPSSTRYSFNAAEAISGCFFLVAIDTLGNVDTTNLTPFCVNIDDCPRYKLPNMFTPNDDNINDYFIPFPGFTSVQRVEMQIFNRWGILVFETTNPEIMWDGKDMNTNSLCPEGVYFYKCKVFEVIGSAEIPEEVNVKERVMTNSIHLLY